MCSLNLFWETLKTSARPPSPGRVESRKGFLSLIKRRPSGCAAGGGPVLGSPLSLFPPKLGAPFCVPASQTFTVLTTWGVGVALSIGSISSPSHGLLSCTLPKMSLSQAGWFLSHTWPPPGFPCDSVVKESACKAGDLGSIPGLGRSPGEGSGNGL